MAALNCLNILTDSEEGDPSSLVVGALFYTPVRDLMRWMKFPIYLPAALGSGVYSVCNRNEYEMQKK
jgi:hypothetical protein